MDALDRNMRMSFPFLKIVALRHRSKRSNTPWKRVERQGVIRSVIARPRARLLPIQIAAERVRKIDPQVVQAMMDGLRACLARLRTGQGHLNHVLEFDYATMTASLIERQGVVRGLAQQISGADAAIMSMRLRTEKATGEVGPLFENEITALDTLIEIHHFQLKHISQGEYETVLRSIVGRLGGKMQEAVAQVDQRRAG
jgi:hypothetical protein